MSEFDRMGGDLTREISKGITRYRYGAYTTFLVEGENSFRMQNLIREAAEREPGDIALHVRKLRQINSGFIGLVMMLHRDLTKRGRKLVLLNPSGKMRDLILVMNLHDELTVMTRLEDKAPASQAEATPRLQFVEQLADGIRKYAVGGYTIISVAGEECGEDFETQLRRAVQNEPGRVVVHVDEKVRVGESSVAMLHALAQESSKAGREFGLYNPSMQLHALVRECEYEEEMPIFTDLEMLLRR